jgi:hypothetical protein
MATSHYCNGKWKPGPVSACPKHKRLDPKRQSVFRSADKSESSSSDSGGDSSD